jgi:phosphoenolpyruvate carboxylase
MTATATATGTLDADLELLAGLVHDMLSEQEGADFADGVDWLHATAARLRDGDERAGDELFERLHSVPAGRLEPYIRACSLQLQLANIAEERERLRRRRQYDDGATPTRRRRARRMRRGCGRRRRS